MNINLLFSKIGVSSNIVQDITLIIFVLGISLFFGLIIGRQKLIPMLIGIYISLALLMIAPKEYLINYYYQLIFFFVVVSLIILLSKEILQISVSNSGFLWRIFTLSFLEVMLILNIVLSILPKKVALGYISSTTYTFLTYPNMYFIWMLIPLIFVYLIRKNLN